MAAYHRRALPFTAEDFARTSLLRILPQGRYRLAGQSDSRFQAFAGNAIRIAYRQQGATPAFLLFAGPGQDAHAAAVAAASWAEANWRPNAIQTRVRTGVVVVHIAPGGQLAAAGPVTESAVPSAIWTIDSDTGRVEVAGRPPGSPAGGEMKRAAAALLKGAPVPSLGELDVAERNVMRIRTIGPPRLLTGALSICLILILVRFGLGGVFSLFALPALLEAGNMLAIGSALVSVLILAGILLGLGLLLNAGNLAYRTPGFSSPEPRTRNLAWGGFGAAMVSLLVIQQAVLPAAVQTSNAERGPSSQFTHVTATVSDDGSETYVLVGGDVTVDLSGWPSSEWPGVQFKTSNPSVLSLDSTPSFARPVAKFGAHQAGAARVDATSTDGHYTFEVRVNVLSNIP